MKILMTGFTSRTVGGRPTYDYMSNVYVLKHALELAGHEVDQRRVSIEETDLTQRYDTAIVGIAACNGLSSRYKLGAMWTMSQFGARAGIFPSDGKNVGQFISSVRTSINHLDTFLGKKLRERNNIIEHELGEQRKEIWKTVLNLLLQGDHPWPVLVPTFSWGNARPYERTFRAPVTIWDPTCLAWPMQFKTSDQMSPPSTPRQRRWVMPTLQDQDRWLDKQRGSWEVLEIGNKRKGEAYVPEKELIEGLYRENWGTMAFGYPMSDGGWWRMRYIHAAIAGAVMYCGYEDHYVIGGPYKHARPQIENMPDGELENLARSQHEWLFDKAWPEQKAIEAVDSFVRGLY